MTKLVVNVAAAPRSGVRSNLLPQPREGANVRRPFYRSRLYLATLAVLTLAAALAMSGAIWRLMHFAR